MAIVKGSFKPEHEKGCLDRLQLTALIDGGVSGDKARALLQQYFILKSGQPQTKTFTKTCVMCICSEKATCVSHAHLCRYC